MILQDNRSLFHGNEDYQNFPWLEKYFKGSSAQILRF